MEDPDVSGKKLPRNPGEDANILSRLLFCWVMPIFMKSRYKEIGMDDLYEALEVHKSKGLGDKMSEAWDRQVRLAAVTKKKPSLLQATLRVFGAQLAVLGLKLTLIEGLFKVAQPIFLGNLISYFELPEDERDVTMGFVNALGVILCSACSVVCIHPYMLSNLHLGMKMRLGICGIAYRKALRLSKSALTDTTVGQVVNLLSNDVGRLEQSILFLHYLWLGPLETIIITYLMYRDIGLSAIFGVLFLLAFIPLQIYMGKLAAKFRWKTAICTDERIRMMNEIIQGIQVIKMYAWEKPFGEVIERIRKKELRAIRYASYVRGIVLSFIIFSTRMCIFVSMIFYALYGNIVTAKTAFMITAYYAILRQTMTVFFPQGIAQLAETLVSMRRIESYMLYGERDNADKLNAKTAAGGLSDAGKTKSAQPITRQESVDKNQLADRTKLSKPDILITNMSARWSDKSETASPHYTLSNINMRVQPGTLVAIIGPVGAGKSSLIQAILGELRTQTGSIKLNGEISYSSQEPWLFSASVRQNILFGLPMERARYSEVVKRCALEDDYNLLTHGDRTDVGERGQSLSGGQKARIGLARACYRKAAIYLLDDPLSAVDTHVGRHLFDQCLRLFLRGKTVLLVTHQLHYLPHVDQIIIMDNGKIAQVGTYDSLVKSGLDFAMMLNKTGREDEESAGESVIEEKRIFTRSISDSSIEPIEDQGPTVIIEEMHTEGKIDWTVYKRYLSASGGFFPILVLLIFCVGTQIAASGSDFYLNFWVTEEEALHLKHLNETDSTVHFKATADVYFFSAFTLTTIVVTLIRSIIFFSMAVHAAKKLHNAMYTGVTRASMYFFNTNPSGRILNRFSKDMGLIDEILPSVLIDVIQIFLTLAGIVIVVAVVNPYFIIPTIILGCILYLLRCFYLKSSMNIKRMEAITRSPIYSYLGASLTGLSTIRAFHAEEILVGEFDRLQDLNSSAFYLFLSTSRAFGFWLDVFSVIYIAVVTITLFFTGNSGADVGLAITQTLGMTGMVQWGMRQSAELENTMTSVERVMEYEVVDPEIDRTREMTADEKELPLSWPQTGRIEFRNLSQRYAPELDSPPVLKNLNITIESMQKIGVVGRTGAGKSSLINALFRLSYLDGQVLIDGRDTQAISLATLRRKISIIPQEPVLFSGTMRYNLDPFDEFKDEKLWNVLDEVHLKDVVMDMPAGLNTKIAESGSNYSIGQRQLVCLARAILRENKILVMDEATANVDAATDELIQTTIRNKFADCTVITIAHRLNTVIDSDRILVMDKGEAVEFESPVELLTGGRGSRGIFEGMVL